jgi:hypothetical protein
MGEKVKKERGSHMLSYMFDFFFRLLNFDFLQNYNGKIITLRYKFIKFFG